MATFTAVSSVQFELESVGGIWKWVTRANNINSFGQRYEVVDITSPFGPLFSINVPLPGDVVTAMSDSVSSLQQQLQASILISSPIPPNFNIVVTEGAASQDVGNIVITNNGAFGSFLTANASPNTSWLTATPSQVVGVPQNSTASFLIRVSPTTLLAANSPYLGVVNISNQDVPAQIVTSNVIVTVLPKPTISVSPTTVNFTQTCGNPTPSSVSVAVSNTGPVTSTMDFVVAKVNNSSNWLLINPVSGGPLPGGGSTAVIFSLDITKIPQIVGTYSDTIRFQSPTASNSFIDVPVYLNVINP
jgi:hypothetical protein